MTISDGPKGFQKVESYSPEDLAANISKLLAGWQDEDAKLAAENQKNATQTKFKKPNSTASNSDDVDSNEDDLETEPSNDNKRDMSINRAFFKTIIDEKLAAPNGL